MRFMFRYCISILIIFFLSICFYQPCLAGVSDIVKTDINGTPRPQYSGYDIGAYEYLVEPPQNLYVTIDDPNGLKVTLHWDPSPFPTIAAGLAGYRIYYDTDSSEPYGGSDANEGISGGITVNANTYPNTNSITLTGLTPDKNYYFAVKAYDDHDRPSPTYSNEVATFQISSPSNGFFIGPSDYANFEIKGEHQQPGATVEIFVGSTSFGTTQVDQNSLWSKVVDFSSFDDGPITLIAKSGALTTLPITGSLMKTYPKYVSFSSESGAPGDRVTVYVNVDNLSGIAGYNINLSYDSSVLTAIYSSAGADAPSGLFVGDVLDPNGSGTVSLTLTGDTALTDTGPGELATVTFNIFENANKNGSLTFASISLKDESGAEFTGTTSSNSSVTVTTATVASLVIGSTPTDNVMNSADTNSFSISGGNSGGDETKVTWAATSGQITTSGAFTAPIVADGQKLVVTITARDKSDHDLSASYTLTVYGITTIAQKPQGYVGSVPSTYPLLKLGLNTTLTATDNTRNYNWTVTDWNGTVVDSQAGSWTYLLNPDDLFAIRGAGIYTVTLRDADYSSLAPSTLKFRVPLRFTAFEFGGDSGVYYDNQGMDTYTITGGPAVNAYYYTALDLEDNLVTGNNCGRFETASLTDEDNVFSFTNGIPDMIAYRVMVTLDRNSGNEDIQRLIDSDLDEVWSDIFRVVPLITYYGTVVETDGTIPVPGVTVTALHDATKTDTTDANGNFSIINLPDTGATYRFKLSKSGYIEKALTGEQIIAGPIELEALGAGSGTISGSVVLSGSGSLPDDVAVKAKDKDGYYITDGKGDVITVYTTAGDYTLPIPASFAGEGPYTLEFRKTGYIYIEGTSLGSLPNVPLDSIGADITLQPVTQIMVTGTPRDANTDGTYDQVLVKITAKGSPEDVIYDNFDGTQSEIRVRDSNGTRVDLYSFAGDGADTWSFSHNAYENFTITIDADVTDDHDVTNDYKATKVWTYVKTATAPAMTTIADPCTNGGTAGSTSSDTSVTLPPGGLTGDILKSVVVSIVESNTGVEIALWDQSGTKIGNNRIGRIEITMRFDSSLVPPGTLENGTYVIYQAESLEDMVNGVYSQIGLDQIILPIDYTNGYLTFWVSHLSAFGIVAAGGGKPIPPGPVGSGGGGAGCFINSSLSKFSITISLAMIIILLFIFGFTLVKIRKRILNH